VATAVAASEVVIVCVSNYAVTDELLGAREVSAALNGKTIIQLSSGTPKEARNAAAWAREFGAQYLDGAILAYPSHIGSAKAQILISGSGEAFSQHRELLKILGTPVFVGQSPGAAAALDCATLTSSIMATIALIHGVALCESEGVEIEQLVSMVNARLPIRAELNREVAEKIRTQRYDKPQTSLGTWAGVAKHFVHIAQENHLANDVPRFVSQLLDRAVAQGLGEQEIASLIEIIRADETDKHNG
jgi:3-hydroxyisobutyrate dehydrogenase-like beta-hydroxyacid dehydrogenase